jgi:hypothetical protein
VHRDFVQTQQEFWAREHLRMRAELMEKGFAILPKGLLNPFQLEAIRRFVRLSEECDCTVRVCVCVRARATQPLCYRALSRLFSLLLVVRSPL